MDSYDASPASGPRSAHQPPATSSARPTTAATPGGQRRDDGCSTMSSSSASPASSVRRRPSGVRSNAQAMATAIGKPSRQSHTTRLTVHGGSGMTGKTTSAAWMTTKATAP